MSFRKKKPLCSLADKNYLWVYICQLLFDIDINYCYININFYSEYMIT